MGAKTFYNLLLHCYPAAFRHEYGGQMQLMFAEQLGEARRAGPFEQAAVWARAAWDTLAVAPREHAHVILQDLRYALRVMAASPSFTAVAILSLALGIGANAAIFSLWNGVLHASLPMVQRPEQLAILTNPGEAGMWSGRTDGVRDHLTYEEFGQLRDRAASFSGVMASESSLETWRVRFDGGAGEEARGRMVSGGFFELLGVRPAIGRVFTASEDGIETPYAVLSYNCWQRRFGGQSDVLGKSVTVGKAALTIIGVGPRGFIGETAGQQPDLWVPLRMQPRISPEKNRLHDTPPEKVMWLHVFGRLKPGVGLDQAGAEANAIFRAGLEAFYGADAARRPEFLDQSLAIHPGGRGASVTRHEFSSSLTALLAAVGVLLLIACANLANLLLARGAARKPELALRLSLGASRGRLIRQLVTESLALAAMGGVASIAAAYVFHGALVRMIAETDGRFQMSFALDPLTLAFILAATLAAALLFGMLPAWQITKADVGAGLKTQSRGAIGSFHQMRSGRLLVSLQLALSLPLLVGAGLLARTVYNLQRADLGYPGEKLLLARVDLRETAPDGTRRERLTRELAGQFRQIPGVRAVSFSQLGVFSGGNATATIRVEGSFEQGAGRESSMDVVGPGYFSALSIPIVLGREILESDQAAAPKICVINESFVKKFFDGRNPIGLRITISDEDPVAAYQVIGVAKNARTQSLRGDVEPRYYLAAKQSPAFPRSPTFLIRTATETAPIAVAARKAIGNVDAALPVMSIDSIEDQVAPLTAQDRTTARIAIVFGSVALALAAVGLYGVLSYGIARRRAEIAIRIALGARPGRVVAMILSETAGLVLAGLALGAGLAFAASRLIDSRLYGVAPQDPVTLAMAIGLLILVALGAAYLPAHRASRVDPMAALRQE